MNTAYNIIQAALRGIPEDIKELFHKKLSKDFTANKVKRGVKTPDQAIDSAENAIKNQFGGDWQHIKPYMKWIIIKYAKDGIDYWDHVDGVVEYLLMFDKLKRQNKLTSQEKDVNRIKDMHDLKDLIEKYEEEDVSSGSEKDKKIEQGFYDRKEAVLIHNSKKVKIVQPLTENASNFFGQSTQWCTTGTHSSFEEYDNVSGLYIIDFKKNPVKDPMSKIQVTGDFHEIQDAQEDDVDFDEFRKLLGDKLLGLLMRVGAQYNKHRKTTILWYIAYPDIAKKVLGPTADLGPYTRADTKLSGLDVIVHGGKSALKIDFDDDFMENFSLHFLGRRMIRLYAQRLRNVTISSAQTQKRPKLEIFTETARTDLNKVSLINFDLSVVYGDARRVKDQTTVRFHKVVIRNSICSFLNGVLPTCSFMAGKGKQALEKAVITANKKGSKVEIIENKKTFDVHVKRGELVL